MYLYLNAVLENVSKLTFQNSLETPYEFTFELICSKCHEPHKSAVQFNTFEQHEIPGSKGEANYIATCQFCKSRGNISIKEPKGYSGYTESEESIKMLEIDSRGWEISKFIPEQPLLASTATGTVFEDVDLTEGEWYDYDDKAGEQVSVTEVKWEISN